MPGVILADVTRYDANHTRRQRCVYTLAHVLFFVLSFPEDDPMYCLFCVVSLFFVLSSLPVQFAPSMAPASSPQRAGSFTPPPNKSI